MRISFDAARGTITVEALSPVGFEAVGLLSCKDLQQIGFRPPNTIYWQACEIEPAFGVRLWRKGEPMQVVRAVAWVIEPGRSVADAVDETLSAISDALRIGSAQLAGDHGTAAPGSPGVDPDAQVALAVHLKQLQTVWPGADTLKPAELEL